MTIDDGRVTWVCPRCRRTMAGPGRMVDGTRVCTRGNARGCDAIAADRAANPGYYGELKTCARAALEIDAGE